MKRLLHLPPPPPLQQPQQSTLPLQPQQQAPLQPPQQAAPQALPAEGSSSNQALPAEASDALALAVGQLASDPHADAAAGVLSRLLRNVLASPGEPKFRRVRLSNPRIQSAVVDASGGVETLLAAGFEVVFEEPAPGEEGQTEGYAVLAESAELEPLEHALELLAPLLPPAAPPPAPSDSTASGKSSSIVPAEPPPRPALAAGSSGGGATLEPATQPAVAAVVLPASIEREVPDWFFVRSGAELKAAFLAAVRRREQDSTLMTRATRDKLRGAPDKGACRWATIRVRFPEGVSLQGEFHAGEPLAALFAWVADALADPLNTYDLVGPNRRPLDAARGSLRDADLLPSATLLFRWTGESAVAMREAPALRQDLLRAAAASS
eukprot:scaffold5.g826.t1